MRVLSQAEDKRIAISFDRLESRALRAALGEICFGFQVKNFEGTIGCPEDEARALFSRLNEFDLDRDNVLALSEAELCVIRNSHAETLRHLGRHEYETRTGVKLADGQLVLKEVEKIMRSR